MTASFDLVDLPWLPCRTSASSVPRQVSLFEALATAHEIDEMLGETPLITMAAHRLLLAVLHRCFGPQNSEAWSSLWQGKRFPTKPLREYFERWRHRFDLFHAERPFYQVPLGVERARSIACLMFQADNNPTLFDHTTTSRPPALTPATAARHLLAYLSFDFGGIKSADTGSGKESAKASPLNQCAVMMARGGNLFETLMLNLIRYAPEQGVPFRFNASEDVPAWEREALTRSEDRYPQGYLDLLTWQSRRVCLMPEQADGDEPVVKAAVIMKGIQPPEGHEWRGKESMVSFRKRPSAKNDEEPWPPVKFVEGRLFFRDSLALVHSTSSTTRPPLIVDWLRDLIAEDRLEDSRVLPIDVLGFTVDKAKPLFWKHERFPLPLAFLENETLVEAWSEMLETSEAGARALRLAMNRTCELLLAPNADQGGRQPDKGDISNLRITLTPEPSYWSLVEASFLQHVSKLAVSEASEMDRLRDGWTAEVEKASRRALEQALRSLEGTGRSLKAVTQGRGRLEWELKSLHKSMV